MCKHSENYHKLLSSMQTWLSEPMVLSGTSSIPPNAEMIKQLRLAELQDSINRSYRNDQLTEDEADELHAWAKEVLGV